MNKVVPRKPAPALKVDTVDNGKWELSKQDAEQFIMIVVYRGLHCPVCKKTLRELDNKLEKFSERGVEVLAVSGDSKERARKAQDEWGIEDVPIGYGLTEKSAREWGLYVSTAISDKEPALFFEPAVFLVRPDGTLYAASIQSMPFARPSFDDLLKAIDFVVEKDYPARGEA